MATLWLTEFRDARQGSMGRDLPVYPALTTQKITYTGATLSSKLNEETTFIQFKADAGLFLSAGTSDVTADNTDAAYEANTVYEAFVDALVVTSTAGMFFSAASTS